VPHVEGHADPLAEQAQFTVADAGNHGDGRSSWCLLHRTIVIDIRGV
jgi:hypothetical protein